MVRCEIGTASTVARQIDNLNHTDVVGTLAGDDTFLVILEDDDTATRCSGTSIVSERPSAQAPLARTPAGLPTRRAAAPRRPSSAPPNSVLRRPHRSRRTRRDTNGTIVLAYSGGLDTSALIPWLKEKYDYEVVACLVDLGRVKDVPGIMARAEAAGVVAAIAIDAKEEFAEHHCLPALMANALYEDKYPLVTAIGRPLIAKKLVETAHRYDAGGRRTAAPARATTRCASTSACGRSTRASTIIAPARGADWPSREELLDYVAAHGIPINLTKKSPYSIDENLWGAATSAARSRIRGRRLPRTPSSSSRRWPTRPTSRSTSRSASSRASRSRSTGCRWAWSS